jgi:hypothetical protein
LHKISILGHNIIILSGILIIYSINRTQKMILVNGAEASEGEGEGHEEEREEEDEEFFHHLHSHF